MFNDQSAPRTALFSHGLREVVQGIGAVLRRAGQSIGAGVQSVQVARMAGVMQSMTDAQLAQIGVARKDIGRHAAALITKPAVQG